VIVRNRAAHGIGVFHSSCMFTATDEYSAEAGSA
jgi:hypothetical protein